VIFSTLLKNYSTKIFETFPWIKSREKLLFTFLLETSIFFVCLNIVKKSNDNILFNLFLSFLLLIIWFILSYVFGRYEEEIIDFKKYILNKSFLILLVGFLSFFIIKIVYILIYNDLNDFFELNNYLLSIFIILISEIITINLKKNKNIYKIENWIFIDGSINPKILEKILEHSRTQVNVNFIKIKEIRNLNLSNIDGLVIENIELIENEYSDYLYLKKDKKIRILSLTEWAGLILQRFPSEIINQKNSSFKRFLLNNNFNITQLRLKRVSELVISIILLSLSFPLIILSAILIKLEDGGPIFYTQVRTGYKEKTFRIFKLRTMKINSEKNGPIWSTKNDKRITKIGDFLRKSRIDELPQLIQVINGKISLIGPRPERPDFDKVLKEKIPNYDLRYFMKPGITGWAQVNYPYGASIIDANNKLSYDLYYIHNFSTLLDLLILFKTIKLVLYRKGAIALS